MTENPKLAQIRALLAKAERTENPVEAEAYTAKAMEMIAKYGIEEAQLEAKGGTKDTAQKTEFVVEGKYTARRELFLQLLAKALRCSPIKRNSLSTRTRSVTSVYGMGKDIERLRMLWTSLDLQLAKVVNETRVPAWENGRTFRTNLISGFSNRVVSRVKDAEAVAREETYRTEGNGHGTDLVLMDHAAQVQALFKANHDKVRTYGYSSSYSSSGFNAGDSAGRRANIGSGSSVGGSGRIALNR